MENAISAIDRQALVLPSLGKIPELKLSMEKIVEAEKRLIEAKTVSPATYADLESAYNESYRDLKRHLSSIGYNIAMTEKAMENAKAHVLLDTYPGYIESNGIKDNADIRKALLARDEAYSAALDRYNQLKALESNFDGKVKVLENVCRYMRKQMDLLLRSGLSNRDYYNTNKG